MELRLIPANKANKIYKLWFFKSRLNKVKKPKPPIDKNKKYALNFKKSKDDLNKQEKTIVKAKINIILKILTFLTFNIVLGNNLDYLYNL